MGAFYCLCSHLEVVYSEVVDYDECCAVCFYSIIYSSVFKLLYILYSS